MKFEDLPQGMSCLHQSSQVAAGLGTQKNALENKQTMKKTNKQNKTISMVLYVFNPTNLCMYICI